MAYPKRMSSPPKFIQGYEWCCWCVGISTYRWRCEEVGEVGSHYSKVTYWATIKVGATRVSVGGRFRSKEGAMRAAVREFNRRSGLKPGAVK